MEVHLSDETLRWLVGGGIAAAIGLLTAMVRELRSLNGKIGELLIRESHRDAEVQTIKATITKLPCVENGFICPTKER